MSAECDIHGVDLVGTQWDEGGLSCPVCDIEALLAERDAEIISLKAQVAQLAAGETAETREAENKRIKERMDAGNTQDVDLDPYNRGGIVIDM